MWLRAGGSDDGSGRSWCQCVIRGVMWGWVSHILAIGGWGRIGCSRGAKFVFVAPPCSSSPGVVARFVIAVVDQRECPARIPGG